MSDSKTGTLASRIPSSTSPPSWWPADRFSSRTRRRIVEAGFIGLVVLLCMYFGEWAIIVLNIGYLLAMVIAILMSTRLKKKESDEASRAGTGNDGGWFSWIGGDSSDASCDSGGGDCGGGD